MEEYNIQNPQSENQSGIEKIEEFCKYKVIYLLKNQIDTKNGKVTKLFGKSYFLWSKIWDKIKKLTFDKLIKSHPNISDEDINFFLDAYDKSIFNIGNNILIRV